MKRKSGYQIEGGLLDWLKGHCDSEGVKPYENVAAAGILHYLEASPEIQRAIRQRYAAWSRKQPTAEDAPTPKKARRGAAAGGRVTQ